MPGEGGLQKPYIYTTSLPYYILVGKCRRYISALSTGFLNLSLYLFDHLDDGPLFHCLIFRQNCPHFHLGPFFVCRRIFFHHIPSFFKHNSNSRCNGGTRLVLPGFLFG
jgi:hypothetical protein